MCLVHVMAVSFTFRKIAWFCCTDLLLLNVKVQENIEVSHRVLYPLSLGEGNCPSLPQCTSNFDIVAGDVFGF